MTYVAFKNLPSVVILASKPKTMWQSGVRSCIVPGLPTQLLQGLNVGTVHVYRKGQGNDQMPVYIIS